MNENNPTSRSPSATRSIRAKLYPAALRSSDAEPLPLRRQRDTDLVWHRSVLVCAGQLARIVTV
jgi:hypothetical protein